MIIDRYIAREILLTLLAVLVVLLVIFVSNRFIRYLAEVSGGGIDAGVVFSILGLKTMSALVIILPLGLFMAVLLAFSRLYKDSEMTAMTACGVTLARVYRPVLMLAFAVALVVGAVSFLAAPWAEERSYQIRDDQQAHAVLAGIAPGRFTRFGGSRGVFYFQRLSRDGETMYGIFARQQSGSSQTVLSAERGYSRFDDAGRQHLVFENGFRYDGVPGAAGFRIIEFSEHSMRMEQREVSPTFRKQRALPTASLLASDEPADAAELQWRVSMPLSVMILALLAVPLSRTSPRQGKYAKLFIAILVYLVYNNMLGMSTTWITRGVLPPLIGTWWVHITMLIAVWILFARQYGLKYTLSRMRMVRSVA